MPEEYDFEKVWQNKFSKALEDIAGEDICDRKGNLFTLDNSSTQQHLKPRYSCDMLYPQQGMERVNFKKGDLVTFKRRAYPSPHDGGTNTPLGIFQGLQPRSPCHARVYWLKHRSQFYNSTTQVHMAKYLEHFDETNQEG